MSRRCTCRRSPAASAVEQILGARIRGGGGPGDSRKCAELDGRGGLAASCRVSTPQPGRCSDTASLALWWLRDARRGALAAKRERAADWAVLLVSAWTRIDTAATTSATVHPSLPSVHSGRGCLLLPSFPSALAPLPSPLSLPLPAATRFAVRCLERQCQRQRQLQHRQGNPRPRPRPPLALACTTTRPTRTHCVAVAHAANSLFSSARLMFA